MAVSHVDRMNTKTWTMSIVCCILTFVNVLVFTVAAHFPHIGFPCYYPHVVDFDNMNLTTFNAIHHLTPQLYLDSAQTIAYVAFTEIVFLSVLVYYVACWFKVVFRKAESPQLNQNTRDIAFLGDPSSCFTFVLAMDSFQIYLLMLSFRLPAMIAFSKCIYFICLTSFVTLMVTRYESRDRTAFALAKIHPSLQTTVKYRTLIVNLAQAALGAATMVFAMSLCLGLGNSFFVRTAHMVFGAMIAFAVLATAYFIVIETFFIRYGKVQFGYHLGTLGGVCGAMYPILRYEAINASEYARDINITLIVLLLLCIGFSTIRIVRFLLRRNRKYRPLQAGGDEIKALRGEFGGD